MKAKNKYILSLIFEIILILFYIIYPRLSLNLIGVKGHQINLFFLFIIFSVHGSLSSLREVEMKNELKELKKVNMIIEILRIALVLFALYRLQTELNLGIFR